MMYEVAAAFHWNLAPRPLRRLTLFIIVSLGLDLITVIFSITTTSTQTKQRPHHPQIAQTYPSSLVRDKIYPYSLANTSLLLLSYHDD